MNLWKASTIALGIALVSVVGMGRVSSAHASAGWNAPHVGYDWAREQPNMQRALNDLAAARNSLEKAAENKGGWRALALQHTDEAVYEVKRGMEYARNHPKDD